MLYSGHSLEGSSYRSAEMQLMYSTVPADWARVDLGVMAMKGYSTFSKALGQESCDQMQFIIRPRTLVWGFLPLGRGTVSVYYNLSRQSDPK